MIQSADSGITPKEVCQATLGLGSGLACTKSKQASRRGRIRTESGPGSPRGQPAWGGGSDRPKIQSENCRLVRPLISVSGCAPTVEY